MSVPMLRFTVRGKVRSNNRNWGFVANGRPFKEKDAALYQEKVWSECYRAAAESRWHMLAIHRRCSVTIMGWNVKLDIDNIPKTILDGMAGVAYENDNQIRGLFIVLDEDPYDERVEITVQQIVAVQPFFGGVMV